MKALITLHLGARSRSRIPSAELTAAVLPRFDSFSLQPVEGWFRGEADPGWSLGIATDLIEELVALADHLRRRFGQLGVGISVQNRYFRLTESTDLAVLADTVRNLLPEKCLGRVRQEPGPWREVVDGGAGASGAIHSGDRFRSTAGERFCRGKADTEAGTVRGLESGSSRHMAECLHREGWQAGDLSGLVAKHPEFLPLQEALALLVR